MSTISFFYVWCYQTFIELFYAQCNFTTQISSKRLNQTKTLFLKYIRIFFKICHATAWCITKVFFKSPPYFLLQLRGCRGLGPPPPSGSLASLSGKAWPHLVLRINIVTAGRALVKSLRYRLGLNLLSCFPLCSFTVFCIELRSMASLLPSRWLKCLTGCCLLCAVFKT